MNAVVDNDIILKGACYGLLNEILVPTCESIDRIGVLGASRFVTGRRALRTKLNGDVAAVISGLDSFFARAVTLEPTDQEGELAAELEFTAQQYRVSLDSGESQLCAIVIARGISRLLTGDKRAVRALETLFDADRRLHALSHKVRCLEQLILIVLATGEASRLKAAICAEPNVDKTLSICFSCSTGGGNETSFTEGIQSYVKDLRSVAGRVLDA